jgi:predicted RNase H-like nuclease (RuvC/YqgF family)
MQENPLAGMEPPTEAIEPLWPLFTALAPWIVGAIGAMWAAWLQFQQWRNQREDKIIDREREQLIQAEQRKQAIELEQLKQEFEQRQKLFETLQAQLREQLDEGRSMRKELAEAREELVRRDQVSRVELQNRDNTISELKSTIVTLNMRISHLEREVKQMEQSNALHLRQAHSTGVTTP